MIDLPKKHYGKGSLTATKILTQYPLKRNLDFAKNHFTLTPSISDPIDLKNRPG